MSHDGQAPAPHSPHTVAVDAPHPGPVLLLSMVSILHPFSTDLALHLPTVTLSGMDLSPRPPSGCVLSAPVAAFLQ